MKEKKNKFYPKHIYDPARQDVAVSYIKHEFRKLLRQIPEGYWKKIDTDISEWISSPELATPRDFWNGFHGICMGFKLKIGLVYFVTAENVIWSKKRMLLSELCFGVEFKQTSVVGEGKLCAKEVVDFYSKPENERLRSEWLELVKEKSSGTVPRDEHPVIVVQKEKDGEMVYSVYDGNRRLAKAILEGKESVESFVGEFTEGKMPKNYWIPTTILMENLLFARLAYERRDKDMFGKYMSVLQDMLEQSESAKYELKERALTRQQPFRDDVLKFLL